MGLFGRNRIEGTKRAMQSSNDALARGQPNTDDQIKDLVREISALRDTMWAIHRLQTARDVRHTENIMAAIDQLKIDLAALIGEATSDINALIAAIVAANANQDPAITALSDQATAATKTLHDAFTAATGTPVVVPVTPPTATDPTTGQPLPAAPPVAATPPDTTTPPANTATPTSTPGA